jgi:Predicted dehydrogenases and related proteins
MRKKYKVALLSAGMIMDFAHIPAYKNLPEAFEICAICDIRLQAAQVIAEKHNIPGVYTDYEQMLEEIRPDIVSVCTPNSFHAEQTITALRHGAHVICEKPLALKYSDAVKIFDEARAAKRHVFPCQSARFTKEFLPAKEIVSAGELGGIYYGDITCVRRRGVPDWGTFHIKENSGGGAFCDIGVHVFDFFLWSVGNPRLKSISGEMTTKISNKPNQLLTSLAASGAPKGVTAPREFDYREFDNEEFACGFARFEGDISVNFKVAWVLNHPEESRINIIGDRGGLSVPEMKLHSSLGRYQADISPIIPDDPIYTKEFYGHWRLFEQVLKALDGEAPPVTPEEALNVAAVIEGFYRSAEMGREVFAEELVEVK